VPGAAPLAPAAAAPHRENATPASAVSLPHEPEPAKTATPLRSLSLEFTPDGAQDVRLRLSERSGEVHISLHTSDPSLTEKLSGGIHDLAGSLASAGYDAHAWTPDAEQQRQRDQPEQPPDRRQNPAAEEGEGFEDLLGQNPQEGS
jgi:hypothetical protein